VSLERLRAGARESSPTRRDLLRLGAGLLAAPARDCAFAATSDAAPALGRRLREAARTGAAVRLPTGVVALRSLELPDGATLIGVRGRTVLKLLGAGPLLQARFARRIALESLILDGADGVVPPGRGLADFADVLELSMDDCVIRRSTARGVNLLRSGGRFAQNTIEHVRETGYFSLDGLGVDIDGNRIRECGDNGAQIWTTSAGRFDGSRLRGNTIEDIHNLSGGTGEYGNGVNVFRAGGVVVERNRIYRCAYTAVRNNAGHDVSVVGNDCKTFGEKAMYAEFGARRSVFRDNRIDDAGGGVAVANAAQGTDVGSVTGNVITNIGERHPDREFGPNMFWLTGILAESNCEISGNTVIDCAWIGIAFADPRRNLRAEGNRLEGHDYGVAVAVGEGLGAAAVLRNRIGRSRKAAVAAMAGLTFQPGDLASPGAAGKYPRIVVSGNETS